MISLNEYIADCISRTKIFEMAFNRSRYQNELKNLANQLIENWCLVRYCSINDKNNINYHHWKKELRGHLMNLSGMLLKTDKRNATKELLLQKEQLNNTIIVTNRLAKKWFKEQLDIDASYTDEIVSDFVEYGIYEIIDIVCVKTSKQEITDYIDNI